MTTDETLRLALLFEHKDFLPKEWIGKSRWIWVRAICKVAKIDGSHCYCVMSYDGVETSIVKDFGNAAQIARIESIHPTCWLKPNDIPTFTSPANVAQYLCQLHVKPEDTYRMMQTDPLEINRLIIKTAVMIKQKEQLFWQRWRSRPKYRRRYRRK